MFADLLEAEIDLLQVILQGIKPIFLYLKIELSLEAEDQMKDVEQLHIFR